MRTGSRVEDSQIKSVRITVPRLGLPDRDSVVDALSRIVPSGHAYEADAGAIPPPMWGIGVMLAEECGTGWPLGMLIHHDIPLGWHQDRQAPPDTWNITLMLRPPGTVDYLVVDGVAHPMLDRSYVHFDNKSWHGVYRYEPGGRYAITYYVPAP